MFGDKIPRAEKKLEAIKRLKTMGVCPAIITDFLKKDKVALSDSYSETIGPVREKIEAIISEFETEHNALVYLAIHKYMDIGFFDTFSLLSLLFVSDYKDDWKSELKDLEDGYAMTYTINLDAKELSEMGSIHYEVRNGIPVRPY